MKKNRFLGKGQPGRRREQPQPVAYVNGKLVERGPSPAVVVVKGRS